MTEAQKRNFYGDDDRPTRLDVIASLRAVTGSETCARELEQAANEVEAACPGCALTDMPEWWC